ncbi:hypothetical protein Avbf_02007 [Armadillidium vulgare]|nr:hypothetical protein Avbf_02007 [Armadillidium vulgare]
MDESNMESRVTNFCGHVRKRHLVTSSNAATILYKTPKLEDGFKITVNFVRHPNDLVIVGGSPGLDTSSLHVEELFCGLDSNPRVPWSRVLCDVTGVRLVSSGRYDNSVTVAVTPLTSLEELPTTMCEAVV